MYPRPPLGQRLRPGQRLALDCLAAAGYALAAWVLFAHKVTPWPLAVAGTLLVASAVAACRYRPVLAFAAALAGFWLSPLATMLAFLALPPLLYVLYRVAGHCRLRIAVIVLAVALSGPLATALPGFAHTGAVLPFAVAIVLAWTIGYALGEHRRYGEQLVRHHAGLAEVERERARRGATEERMRIARELHDVVAHSMSVITVQAGYGHLVIDERPDEARAALSAIESTGRETLAEMRRLLGVLRSERHEVLTAPQPGLGDLAELVDGARRAGAEIELIMPTDVTGVAPAVELTAYRIVQEAVSNAGQHAPGVPVTVALAGSAKTLTVTVTNGPAHRPALPGGPGHGLLGMRERATMLGGELSAGPMAGGGFLVRAILPLTGEVE
jgi:signal transduction histidine kinase